MAEFDFDAAKQVIDGGIDEAKSFLDDPEKMDSLLTSVKAQVANLPTTVTGALTQIPTLAAMAKSYVTKEYGEVSPKVVASLVSAFLYLVTKKDLIDDSVPVLGIADDLAVVALAMKVNEKELEAYKQWRDANNLPEAQIEA